MTIASAIKKWEKTGLLIDLSKKDKEALTIKLELMAQLIKKQMHNNVTGNYPNKYGIEFHSIIFPLLVRCFHKNKETNSIDLFNWIYNLDYRRQLESIKNYTIQLVGSGCHSIDIEAEITAWLSEQYQPNYYIKNLLASIKKPRTYITI